MVFRDDDELRLGRAIGGRVQTAPARRFAILRCAKIKTLGNMGASLQHTFRERDTPNADPARRTDNTVLIGGTDSAAVLDAWRARAPDKIRANAVHGLEYFIGGSPEALKAMSRDQQDAYFRDALDWLKARHGAENILSAVIHRDETTPHMTVMTIPLDQQGKLNARAIVGSRHQLSAMQTDFARTVGQAHGLQRGVEGSRATHERVRRVYAHISAPEASVSLPERHRGGFMGRGGETDTEWRQRASDAASEALLGVQHALRRERRDRAAEVEGLRQRLQGSPDHQKAIKGLETQVGWLKAETDRLRDRLSEVSAEAAAHYRNALKLDTAREVILNHAVAFVRDHGLDDAAMLARMQTGLNEALAEFEPAQQERIGKRHDAVQETRQHDEGLDHGD